MYFAFLTTAWFDLVLAKQLESYYYPSCKRTHEFSRNLILWQSRKAETGNEFVSQPILAKVLSPCSPRIVSKDKFQLFGNLRSNNGSTGERTCWNCWKQSKTKYTCLNTAEDIRAHLMQYTCYTGSVFDGIWIQPDWRTWMQLLLRMGL